VRTSARRSHQTPDTRPCGSPTTTSPGSRVWCDTFNERLPKLVSFILPGGTPGAAYLHVARTVTRRAERSVWALLEADPERTNPLTARYLNRLSDLLFILGRVANPNGDVLWRPGGPAV
jgi:cob(I)alamin adenosyltransferase